MLEDVFIVKSAVSAFNNAALYAPAFLWWGILALPLFVVTWMCSDVILARLGWNRENILGRVSWWTIVLSFAWLIMFSGNYSVLRDGLSALPMVMAASVFLMAVFIGSHMRDFTIKHNKMYYGLVALVVLCVGLSDVRAWWGALLQIGALVLGWIFGRLAPAGMRPVAGTVLILSMVTVAMLMQPEFFRFGQLGNLTVLHLGAMLVFGVAAVATLVLNNIPCKGRIHKSAFIKLKWLSRCVSLLAGALFLLTEAVPVYIGMLVMVGIMFAMSVWHLKDMPGCLVHKIYALMLMMFGVMTVMPVITVFGILYWGVFPCDNVWREIKRLL